MINDFNNKWEDMWKEVEENVEDVLEEESEFAKSMEINELGSKGGDILYKEDSISASLQ